MGGCLLGITSGADSATSSLADEGGWAAAFVGTLDNLAELDHGSASRTPSPAAILLSLFRQRGVQSAQLLRGTFAAVVTDGRRLWCFRDHLGFEPLFYAERDGALFVASEVKQVLFGAALPQEPDVEFLEDIFFGEQSEEGRCAYTGIRRLPLSTSWATCSVPGIGNRATSSCRRRSRAGPGTTRGPSVV
jgi:asparagine synthetase B (glutamine-hydrolysing)